MSSNETFNPAKYNWLVRDNQAWPFETISGSKQISNQFIVDNHYYTKLKNGKYDGDKLEFLYQFWITDFLGNNGYWKETTGDFTKHKWRKVLSPIKETTPTNSKEDELNNRYALLDMQNQYETAIYDVIEKLKQDRDLAKSMMGELSKPVLMAYDTCIIRLQQINSK